MFELSKCLGAVAVAVGVLALSCEGEVGAVDDTRQRLSYEEFKAQAYREPGSGIYIVDGDTPAESEEELRALYDSYVQQGALTINMLVGVDGGLVASDQWSATMKTRLTYCVSTAFGTRQAEVVSAMRAATSAWANAANVAYTHLRDQDATCTESNTAVVFAVLPTTGQPYIARAFFPSQSRATRNVLIDSQAFGNLGVYTLSGVLRHELGHTLGFRHEHIRPEVVSGCLPESNNFRAVTAYDSASVMHYPQCNGTNRGDLVLTALDRQGALATYGAPAPILLGGGGNLGLMPRAVTTDGTNVYWSTLESVLRVPVSGGVTTTVARGVLPFALSLVGGALYWSEFQNQAPSTIRKTVGGVTQLLASDVIMSSPQCIGVLGSTLYWANSNNGPAIRKASINGGGMATVVPSFANDVPECLTVDASYIYLTTMNSGQSPTGGKVYRVPLAGGAPQVIVSGGYIPFQMASDLTAIYWTDLGANKIMKWMKSGGAPIVLATSPAPSGIAVDGTFVYWTSRDGGVVGRVPKTGGTATTLASGQATPVAIAVDDTSIFWVNEGNGAVLRLVK